MSDRCWNGPTTIEATDRGKIRSCRGPSSFEGVVCLPASHFDHVVMKYNGYLMVMNDFQEV